jgi:hypothetical protein
MTVTSPNHEGTDGIDGEENWMSAGKDGRLGKTPSLPHDPVAGLPLWENREKRTKTDTEEEKEMPITFFFPPQCSCSLAMPNEG